MRDHPNATVLWVLSQSVSLWECIVYHRSTAGQPLYVITVFLDFILGRRRHPSDPLPQSQNPQGSRLDLCHALDITVARIGFRLSEYQYLGVSYCLID